jgi:hypothetical protein
MTSPIARCPARPPPAARTTAGARAPVRRAVVAIPATRPDISRVRSASSVVISAGIAVYGAWKNAKTLAIAR